MLFQICNRVRTQYLILLYILQTPVGFRVSRFIILTSQFKSVYLVTHILKQKHVTKNEFYIFLFNILTIKTNRIIEKKLLWLNTVDLKAIYFKDYGFFSLKIRHCEISFFIYWPLYDVIELRNMTHMHTTLMLDYSELLIYKMALLIVLFN